MTISDYINKDLPEYTDTMYMNGYTPEQILSAFRNSIRENLREPDKISFTCEVKMK